MDATLNANGCTAIAALFLCWVTTLLVIKARQKTRLPLPPGPRGWPVIGNAFDIPKDREWLTFMDWSRKYGACFLPYARMTLTGSGSPDSSLLYYEVWGQPYIVINSSEAAVDLFERRSSIYADRQVSPPTIPVPPTDVPRTDPACQCLPSCTSSTLRNLAIHVAY